MFVYIYSFACVLNVKNVFFFYFFFFLPNLIKKYSIINIFTLGTPVFFTLWYYIKQYCLDVYMLQNKLF